MPEPRPEIRDLDLNELVPPGYQRAALIAAARSDFVTFAELAQLTLKPGEPMQPTWHVEAIGHHLEQVRLGKCRRLLITLPPRSLKSTLASICWPGYLLGLDPRLRILAISYGQQLAGDFHRAFRGLVNSQTYREVFPQTRFIRLTEEDARTGKGGFRQAVAMGGSLTGRGADLIIVDDPLKADDAISDKKRAAANEWYRSTLLTRLDNKEKGAIVVVMQRLHMDDLAGHLLESGDWRHLNLPAIAEDDEDIAIGPGLFHRRKAGDLLNPSRESRATLDRLRSEMGTYAFSAQYQQAPIPVEGELLKWSWFTLLPVEAIPRSGRIIQSWDIAFTDGMNSNWSVCLTATKVGQTYHVIDIFRARLTYPDLKPRIIQHAHRFGCSAPIIEDAGIGTALLQDLHRAGIHALAYKPKGDKVTRAAQASGLLSQGLVTLPAGHPELRAVEEEIKTFPNGAHDDIVDALVQMIDWDQKPRASIRDFRA